ncbi:hypothetical protein L207DRAFT_560399 [Hyaloscypha variabilis F]|uniref:Uncharacterized protein n=1 Tax=Hyaloscypha variabilis (strain UAMH 11265 / GT02V1 / F) TaxID=1149755 RepID=A0A2J6SDI0_HYAVF|nr:hypothetical protein L207DRAFT_560399 [Hyaloscypha variabilis F]
MSDNEKQQTLQEDNQYEYASDTDDAPEQQVAAPQPRQQQGQRTMQRARQNQSQDQQFQVPQQQAQQQQMVPAMDQRMTGNMGGRTGAIRESRIKDRPQPKEERDSSLKIKIELDLEVEVDLYARVKGDVTIGLM